MLLTDYICFNSGDYCCDAVYCIYPVFLLIYIRTIHTYNTMFTTTNFLLVAALGLVFFEQSDAKVIVYLFFTVTPRRIVLWNTIHTYILYVQYIRTIYIYNMYTTIFLVFAALGLVLFVQSDAKVIVKRRRNVPKGMRRMGRSMER